MLDPVPAISKDLGLPNRGVAAVLRLIDDQATVPFIARYRKEATGGLDEVQIRAVRDRRAALVELEKRRDSIRASIEEQGKLTAQLAAALAGCKTKTELEDLYLPYKKKRATRAQKARDRGLEPLARRILGQGRDGHPAREREDDLAGARDIVAEIVSEDATVRAMAREVGRKRSVVRSSVVKGKDDEGATFRQYFDYRESAARIPSHRWLAICRGEREGVLRVKLEVGAQLAVLDRIRRRFRLDRRSPWSGPLDDAITDGWKRLVFPALDRELRSDLKRFADEDAIDVFARNLGQLLLSAPVGARAIVGIDPGLRTGCKLAAVSATGAYLGQTTIYPARGSDARRRSADDLVAFVRRHEPWAVGVGNGTGGRDTLALTRDALRDAGLSDTVVVEVNEAGASVYSASDVARAELPDVDVSVRGAVSIARRLQDPLSELVKIEPRSIGVGQYQHDVDQGRLERKLGEVVESCVNRVGVDLNTASPALLGHVAGIGPKLAERIAAHRDRTGRFQRRRDLLKVQGLGARTFEQAAGFLRVRGGSEPLDASAVHPERYDLVRRMAGDAGCTPAQLVGDADRVARIPLDRYRSDEVGEPTLRDIADELARPGRDPRAAFEPPQRRDDVRTLEDLREGMQLEGVVTNVTNFGAFVDIGVKQDGLIHVSQLADRFVRDPHEVASVGDRLRVTVLEIDRERRRISLSARQGQG